MTNDEIEVIISKTVKKTVHQLKRNNMLREYKTSSFKKTEKLLYEYPKMQPITAEGKSIINKIEKALEYIRGDDYYELIELRYFRQMKYDKLVEYFGVERNAVIYHKQRLINKIKPFLFADDVIKETLDD